MKRVIFIFVILFFYFIIINKKIETTFIEKIDLNLLDDEVAIIFLSSDSYKSILLKSNNDTSLLALDINNSKKLNKNINKFVDRKIDYLFLNNKEINIDIDYSVKDILNNEINMENFIIRKQSNIIEINNHKYSLCIYDVGNNNDVSNCDFLYFINMDYQISMSEALKAVFYEKKVANKFKENTYIKWIDNYELSSDTYNILKLSSDSYDIITIPNEN